MAVTYTDAEIAALIEERKLVTERQIIRMMSISYHGYGGIDQIQEDAQGNYGSKFRVILRQNQSISIDFSVVLAVQPVQGGRLFRLRRYDGEHEHTNRLEFNGRKKDKFYDFHIHTATERYQENNLPHDGYAEVTKRYHDIHDAVTHMLGDAKFDVKL